MFFGCVWLTVQGVKHKFADCFFVVTRDCINILGTSISRVDNSSLIRIRMTHDLFFSHLFHLYFAGAGLEPQPQ